MSGHAALVEQVRSSGTAAERRYQAHCVLCEWRGWVLRDRYQAGMQASEHNSGRRHREQPAEEAVL